MVLNFNFASFVRYRSILLLVMFAIVVSGTLLFLMQDKAYSDVDDFENRERFYFGADYPDQNKIIAVADVNGDGALDIVAGNQKLIVYLNKNDGTGKFKPGMPLQRDNGGSITSLALGDLNGDGALDIVEGNNAKPTSIYFNKNNGNGEFEIGVPQGEIYDTRSVKIADINSDGLLDVVAGNYITPIVVYENQKNSIGSFQLKTITTSLAAGTTSLAVGDLNGDQLPDIVAGNEFEKIQVYLNRTDTPGAFNQGSMLPGGNYLNALDIALGDVNRDGVLDIVATNPITYPLIYLNIITQRGQFEEPAVAQFCGSPDDSAHLGLGDVNGDYSLDIAVGSYTEILNSIFAVRRTCLNTNNAANIQFEPFSGLSDILSEYRTSSIAIADVNADGALDLLFGNDGQPGLVFLNTKSESFGYYNGFSYSVALARGQNAVQSHTKSVALGDINRDGALDIVQGNYESESYIYRNVDGTGHFDEGTSLKSSSSNKTVDIALGDMDRNGWLDVVMGNENQALEVYFNNQNQFTHTLALAVPDATTSVVVGDLNRDEWLDIVVGGTITSTTYWNDRKGGFAKGPDLPDSANAQTIRLSDVDGDGLLDIIVTKGTTISVYRNDGDYGDKGDRGFYTHSVIQTTDNRSIAIGDVNNDGAPDIVVGNRGVSTVHLNNGIGGFGPSLPLTGAYDTHDVALGDLNGDSALDIVAVGNSALEGLIYLNLNDELGNFELDLALRDSFWSENIALGDMNGDGLLDIVMSGGTTLNFPTVIYYYSSRGSNLYESPTIPKPVSVGKANIFISNQFTNVVNILPNNPPHIKVAFRGMGNFYASPQFVKPIDGAIPITYTLFDEESDPVGRIAVQYSLNGGGDWLTATHTGDTQVANLAASPYPLGVTHIFKWKILSDSDLAQGFFGQSDNVVIRLIAYPQTTQRVGNDFRYLNSVAGLYQWPYATATTFPIRVRGTLIRVCEESASLCKPLSNAVVYHLKAGDRQGAEPISQRVTGTPWHTDPAGYLPGQSVLNEGDQLMALWPVTTTEFITFTDRISLYYTSAPLVKTEIITGPQFFTVTRPGEQILTVSPANKLMLLNLDVSLEWDASNDVEYLDQLERDLKRASEIVYDLTNGQAALGTINLYQAKEHWKESQIQIFARNDLRPNANLGGIISQSISETINITGVEELVPNAMLPGHIRMGATWNRFGNPSGTVGEDWPRALAHEIGHYAFFLLDNYLGIETITVLPPQGNAPVTQKVLVQVDCRGSAMTNAYIPEYSEFLTRTVPATSDLSAWDTQEDCQKTLAEKTTGRADWQTIKNFYPFLEDNVVRVGQGPNVLALNVTQVHRVPLSEPHVTFAPIINLIGDQDQLLSLKRGEAQAYLIKKKDPNDKQDDTIIQMGTPNGSLIQARGAESGERFCVFNTKREKNVPIRVGCIASLSESNTNLKLSEVQSWQPQITVQPLSAQQLAMTVTLDITNLHVLQGRSLKLQLYPADRPVITVTSQIADMQQHAIYNDRFTAVLKFPITIFHGHIRVWIDGFEGQYEAISEFYVSPGWQGNKVDYWDGNKVAYWDGNKVDYWDGNKVDYFDSNISYLFDANVNSWSAPVSSADGQVAVFKASNILAGNRASILQSMTVLPPMPSWLMPVGQVFRYGPRRESNSQVSDGQAELQDEGLIIQFQYLERELPEVREEQLRIYYSPDEGTTWERLNEETNLNQQLNVATAPMQGGGLYALMATIATPELSTNWQQFGYPDTDPRSVSEALSSLGNKYTSVYHWDNISWKLYDSTVLPEFTGLVNDLLQIEPLQTYYIYMLEKTVPYIGVPTGEEQIQASSVTPFLPATFYGWVEPTAEFIPQDGYSVVAFINGVECGSSKINEYTSSVAIDNPEPTLGDTSYTLHLPLIAVPKKLAYKVQVRADTGDRCGLFGREITFKIRNGEMRDWEMPNKHVWDNSHACYLSLGRSIEHKYKCLSDLAPDLIVERFSATPTDVQIVIKNKGKTPVPSGNGFWVDLYINPTRKIIDEMETWGVNVTWPKVASDGLVWGVTDLALPLEPGVSITLTMGSEFFRPDESGPSGKLPLGTPIFTPDMELYVQVDSTNANNPSFGAVLEQHEIISKPPQDYNNIEGPFHPETGSVIAADANSRFSDNGNKTEEQLQMPPR